MVIRGVACNSSVLGHSPAIITLLRSPDLMVYMPIALTKTSRLEFAAALSRLKPGKVRAVSSDWSVTENGRTEL